MNNLTTKSNPGRAALCPERPVPSGAGNGRGDAIASRLDPGALRAVQVLNRKAFGLFCADLERVKGPAPMSPTMLTVARLIGEGTLRVGVSSLPLQRLEDLVCFGQAEPLVNLGRNDLSPAFKGLADLGVVRLERVRLVPGALGWLVLVFTDSRLWRVGASEWRYSRASMEEWRVHLRSERLRFTPCLQGLAPEADLYDGMAAPFAMGGQEMPIASAIGGQVPAVSALDGRDEAAEGCGSSFVSNEAGAHELADGQGVRAVGCSEGRNRLMRGIARNGGGCSEGQNASLRLKISPKPKLKLRSVEEHKRALYELEVTEDDDRVRAALCVILGDGPGNNDAGKWIRRRWENRTEVQRVMEDVVERMHQCKVERPGGLAEYYWSKIKGISYK